MSAATSSPPTLFGHPTGLYSLFFAEMWERFSYYGMRALLVLYMLKGFLAYDDNTAYAVYGAYGALVYATPFFGGMVADRILGARRAVVLGGLLMAAGHLCMTVQTSAAFFLALALLIVGNGFFKPNISTIVGSLYPEGHPGRDGGFTIFYMGINLGAAMSPLLCGYVGERWGWHYGFGLATVGMLVGLAVFVAPVPVAQGLILVGAIASAVGMVWLNLGSPLLLAVNGFVAVALVAAGVIAFMALSRGGLPAEAGAPADPEAPARKVGSFRADQLVYASLVLLVPLLAVIVWVNSVAGWILSAIGAVALVILLREAMRSEKVERERLFVVLVLMFFSMVFWAFFEQAGSSVNNFTDRNVDRVVEARSVTGDEVGRTITLEVNQEQLGRTRSGQLFTLDQLDQARADEATRMDWPVDADDVGMGVEGQEVPASVFQSANPIFILLFGLAFSAMWTALGARRLEPSTPVKFALGLLQLGAGFGALWYGVQVADERGMVAVEWLLLGYLLHTTGELCLSPVGLSMVTRLSPRRMVSTVMGAWFLATAFSGYLAGIIATFTGVEASDDGERRIPAPVDTLHLYGDVFGTIAISAAVAGVLLLLISPLLRRWMHMSEEELHQKAASGH